MKVLNFAIGSIDFIKGAEDSLFRQITIKAFASGPNAHTLPVDEEVLKRCSYTVYNKPILWKYNPFTDDAMSHEKDEVPCGFVPENEHNPVLFSVEEVDGVKKTFLIINALIWTKYSGRLIEIFERDGMKKDVSIEIIILDDEDSGDRPHVNEFVVAGITILGECINPAVKGCEAELLAFAEDRDRYLMSFDSKYIPIVNTKESSVSGKWSNPRRKLFNPIIEASNTKSLLREAYLIGDFNSETPNISDFKYPHHVVKDGKLVIHKDGLEAAFSRASQQGIVQGNVKSHLLRHYRELGLSTENFSEFNITKEEFELYFAEEFSNNESVGEVRMTENKNVENNVNPAQDTSATQFSDDKDKNLENVNNATNDDATGTNVHCEGNNDDKGDAGNKNENDDDKNDNKNDDSNDKKMSLEEAMAEIGRLTAKCSELEKSNAAYMAKMEQFADYDELKKFKTETEIKMAKDAELSAMNKVMSEISERGIDVSDEDKKELMAKFSDFPNIDAWSNFVKAQIFDKSENFGDVARMQLPFKNTQRENTSFSVWDRL